MTLNYNSSCYRCNCWLVLILGLFFKNIFKFSFLLYIVSILITVLYNIWGPTHNYFVIMSQKNSLSVWKNPPLCCYKRLNISISVQQILINFRLDMKLFVQTNVYNNLKENLDSRITRKNLISRNGFHKIQFRVVPRY